MSSPSAQPPAPAKTALWPWHAAYVLFTILLFNEVVFRGWRFVGRDLLHFFYPLDVKIRETLLGHGSFLWDRAIDNGLPLLARWTPTLFYPTTLLHAVMPPEDAVAVAMLCHFVVSAACTFQLATRYCSRVPAAWVAGLAYAFGGYSLSMVGGGIYFFGASLLPLSLLGLVRLLESPGVWRVIQWSAILTVQIFTAEAQTIFYEGLVLCPVLLFVHVKGGRARLAGAAAAGAAAAIAFGLTFCQLWPMLEFVSLSIRSEGVPLARAQVWSMHPFRLLEVAVPYVFGGYLPDLTYWARSLIAAEGKGMSWAYCLHVGLATVAALPLIPFRDPSRRAAAVAWACVSAFFLLAAFGKFGPLHAPLFSLVPGASAFRYPEKFMVFVSLGICVLGAMGLDRVLDQKGTGARRVLVLLAIVAAGLLGARLWFSPESQERLDWMKAVVNGQNAIVPPGAALQATADALTRALGITAVLLALIALRSRLRPRTFAAAIVLVAAADLFSADIQLRIIGPRDFFAARPALCDAFSGPDHGLKPTVWRDPRLVYRPSKMFEQWTDNSLIYQRKVEFDTLLPNIGAAYCVSYAYGYEAAKLIGHEKITAWLGDQPKRFMDVFGVSYIVARPGEFSETDFPPIFKDESLGIVVHWNHALPYAYAVGAVDPTSGIDDAGRKLSREDYPYLSRALFEGGQLAEHGEAARDVRLGHHEDGSVRLSTSFEAPGYVVLHESYYPGWRAAIDGKEARVYRANGMFLGVPVPSGNHAIDLRFEPVRQRVANRVSVATLSLCVAALAAAAVLARRRARSPAEGPT